MGYPFFGVRKLANHLDIGCEVFVDDAAMPLVNKWPV